jgi:hypothetical protein
LLADAVLWHKFGCTVALPATLAEVNQMSREFKYQWEGLLEDIILEFNPQELKPKIQKLEATIFDRTQALSPGRDHHEEQQALANAISTLRILQKDRLALPD